MLSIIVHAHNEELLLGRTLREQTNATDALGHPSEIIIVDDASTDAPQLLQPNTVPV